jgi:hypothetical protein
MYMFVNTDNLTTTHIMIMIMIMIIMMMMMNTNLNSPMKHSGAQVIIYKGQDVHLSVTGLNDIRWKHMKSMTLSDITSDFIAICEPDKQSSAPIGPCKNQNSIL